MVSVSDLKKQNGLLQKFCMCLIETLFLEICVQTETARILNEKVSFSDLLAFSGTGYESMLLALIFILVWKTSIFDIQKYEMLWAALVALSTIVGDCFAAHDSLYYLHDSKRKIMMVCLVWLGLTLLIIRLVSVLKTGYRSFSYFIQQKKLLHHGIGGGAI